MSVKRYTNMLEAIEELKKRGFTGNFEFLDQTFRDVDSGRTFKADQLTIVEHDRFEEQAIRMTCLSSMPWRVMMDSKGSLLMPLVSMPIQTLAGF